MTKDARKKLEPTTEVGIFLGYIHTPHNYDWLYFPANKMTIFRRDVKFDEDKSMRLSLLVPCDLQDWQEQTLQGPHQNHFGILEPSLPGFREGSLYVISYG